MSRECRKKYKAFANSAAQYASNAADWLSRRSWRRDSQQIAPKASSQRLPALPPAPGISHPLRIPFPAPGA